MNHEIKPLELLFLWRLAVAGGGDWLKDIKPDPESPARKRLQANGVIEQEKRKSPSGRGTAVFVSLTDKGWGWLGNHLDADLSTRTQAGTEVLHRLLLRLKTFIDQKQISLGDLILPGEDRRDCERGHRRSCDESLLLTLKGADQREGADRRLASSSVVHPPTETGPGVARHGIERKSIPVSARQSRRDPSRRS